MWAGVFVLFTAVFTVCYIVCKVVGTQKILVAWRKGLCKSKLIKMENTKWKKTIYSTIPFMEIYSYVYLSKYVHIYVLKAINIHQNDKSG